MVLLAVFVAAGLVSSVSLIAADARARVLSEGSLAPYPQVADPGEGSPAYSQVVDNATPKRFAAPRGWETLSGNAQQYGEDYVESSSGKEPARFRVTVPERDYYTVYARWPAVAENSAAARFGVSTVSGVEWTEVNQQTDGGFWVRLGAYEMAAGDRYAVQVSGDPAMPGAVVADAVMVVRGTQENPEAAAGDATGGDTARAASGYASGYDVVRVARNHIGTPYRLSPPGNCRAFRTEDCSCLTKLVLARFGRFLPEHPGKQYYYGRYVARSNLRPGDLVFFREAGRNRPITHNGIYSGNGNLVHASSYWGKVVERPMKYINGYWGARRLI